MKQKQSTHNQAASGFSLIETLAATFVLCIGLLSAGAMQMTALKNVNANKSREQASFLCSDMIERIRANKTDIQQYVRVSHQYAQSKNIDQSQLSGQDFAEWINSLTSQLSNGSGSIEKSDNVVSITVEWDEPSKSNEMTNHQTLKVDSIL